MKRILLSALLLFAALLHLPAQAPGFIETLSYTGYTHNTPYALMVTPDSCYLVAEQVSNAQSGYSTLVKLDRDGNVIWSQRYSDATHRIHVRDVAPAGNNGFMMTALFDSMGVNHLAIIRVDASGQMMWSRKYTDPAFVQWDGQVIRQTSDGGYILTGAKIGNNVYSMSALRLDSLGNIEWTRNYCIGNNKDRSYDIRELPDSGFVLCGKSTEYNPVQSNAEGIYVLRIDKNGNPLWGKGFGSLAGYPFALRLTPDGGIAVAGFSIGTGFGSSDVALLKLDTAGNLLWMHLYGTSNANMAQSFDVLPDGRFVISGCFTNAQAQQQGMLLLADSAGNLLSTLEYPAVNLSSADKVVVTHDSSILIAGLCVTGPMSYSTALLKTDFSGSLYCGALPLSFGDLLVVPPVTSGFTTDSSGTMFSGIEKYDAPVSVIVHTVCAVNANFYSATTSGCVNAPMQFVNISDTTSSAYWYVNGVLTDSTFNFTHAFGSAGTHTVMMISQPSGDTSQMQLNIQPLPVITVTLPDTICNDLQYFGIWPYFSPSFGTFTTVFGTGDTTLYPNMMQIGWSPITYSYTDGNGCTATVTTGVYVDTCTTAVAPGIGENDRSPLQLYYDVENARLNLSFAGGMARTLEVYNTLGQRVCSMQTRDERVQLALPDPAAGLYVLHVTANGTTAAYRFVVTQR